MPEQAKPVAIKTPEVKTTKEKKPEYVQARDLSREQIEKLPTVLVKIERFKSKRGKYYINMRAEFHDQFSKEISDPKVIDENKFNLIVVGRKSDPTKDMHMYMLPVRFFERTNPDGTIKYRRFEVIFTRKVIISEWFNFDDEGLIEGIPMNFEFKEDKDSTKEFDYRNSEVEYIHFT